MEFQFGDVVRVKENCGDHTHKPPTTTPTYLIIWRKEYAEALYLTPDHRRGESTSLVNYHFELVPGYERRCIPELGVHLSPHREGLPHCPNCIAK